MTSMCWYHLGDGGNTKELGRMTCMSAAGQCLGCRGGSQQHGDDHQGKQQCACSAGALLCCAWHVTGITRHILAPS
jgi:hypothetical protein